MLSTTTARVMWVQVRAGLRLASLVRAPLTMAADVAEEVRDRLARREENFLQIVERLILANPNSPFRPLLEHAGYDLPRLRQLVRARGLDAALDQLRADGVYVQIQEFKGRAPLIRGGRTFRFQDSDFANPTVRGLFSITSGGSRSRGTPVSISEENLQRNVRLRRWALERYGLVERDVLLWITSGAGFQFAIEYFLLGRMPLRWFSPVEFGTRNRRVVLQTVRLASRRRFPMPEVVPADRAHEIARYISRVNTPRGIIVETFPNSALRLVLAAEEAGIALGDVAFLVTGEPLTPAKRFQIESRGCKVLPRFGFNESGRDALGCPHASAVDDYHVMTDAIAVRQHSRVVDQDGTTVPAYLYTSLLPHARYVLLNTESGDYGGLEERRCGCFLDQAGLRFHIHTVRSFEKLTAEGMTYFGSSLIRLVEEVLPREFGGDSRHYQFVEAEDKQGFTRLYLLASPGVGAIDEHALQHRILQEIGADDTIRGPHRVTEHVWTGADTVRVLRRDPLATMAGKVLHLHRDRGTLRPDGDPA